MKNSTVAIVIISYFTIVTLMTLSISFPQIFKEYETSVVINNINSVIGFIFPLLILGIMAFITLAVKPIKKEKNEVITK